MSFQLSLLIKYVPDQYKTQKCVIKLFLKWWNSKVCFSLLQNQEIFNKVVDNYPHALEFVPGCSDTQKRCDKSVDTHHSTIQFVPECYKTQ